VQSAWIRNKKQWDSQHASVNHTTFACIMLAALQITTQEKGSRMIMCITAG
jgi:hypothetical protein